MSKTTNSYDWRQMLTLLEAMPTSIGDNRAYYIETVVIPALLRRIIGLEDHFSPLVKRNDMRNGGWTELT